MAGLTRGCWSSYYRESGRQTTIIEKIVISQIYHFLPRLHKFKLPARQVVYSRLYTYGKCTLFSMSRVHENSWKFGSYAKSDLFSRLLWPPFL